MTDRARLKDRARDELFSHINRCGVLQAADKDQEQWLGETMEYLGERYPDLAEADLKELYTVGLRFCRPAIAHGNGRQSTQSTGPADPSETEVEAEAEVVAEGSPA
jgi:hypothetical protein